MIDLPLFSTISHIEACFWFFYLLSFFVLIPLFFSIILAIPPEQVESMIIQKVRQCRVLFDFTKALSDVSQKDIKRDALLELVEYFVTNRGFLTPNIYKEIIEMVCYLFCLF